MSTTTEETGSAAMPTETGAYMVRAEGIHEARVEVMRCKPDGALWVQDQDVGMMPLAMYHEKLGGTVRWNQLAKSTHKLKCWPQYWNAVAREEKPFELRKNDRDYKADDMLELYEFEPCPTCAAKSDVEITEWPALHDVCQTCSGAQGVYTGRMLRVLVSYVLTEHAGLAPGYAVLGLGKPFVMSGNRFFPEGGDRA